MLSPKTQDSRPITDRVKESLFSVLYQYGLLNGAIVADLFCGVGSLGLEALSRGAEFVTFVEQDPKIISVLNKNIEKAGFVKKSKVIKSDAFKSGALLDSGRQRYSLVFVDPPYACTKDTGLDSPLDRLLNLLTEQIIPEAIVVVRTHQSTALLNEYGQFKVVERRQWGTMAITILKKIRE